MDKHLYKTKITFGIALLVLIFVVVSGSFSLKYNHIFSYKNFQRIASYYSYKTTLAQQQGSNLLASVGSALGIEKKDNPNIYESYEKALSIPVLVYHGIVKDADRFNMTQKEFKEQMIALKDNGYQTITIEDFIDFINGNKELPDKSILITFDDGRKDSFYGADPILRAMKFNAVMFVATNFSIPTDSTKQSSYYLLQGELKDMINSGRWDIQSHAIQYGGGSIPIDVFSEKGNFLSNFMWKESENRLETLDEYRDRLNDELSNSKKRIENLLGNNVLSFSYPFGDYGQQSENNKNKAISEINKVVKNNYKIAFHQIWPIDHDYSQNHPKDNPYYLKRIEPSPEWSGEELIYWLNIGRYKNLPYNDNFISNNGWKSAWGGVSLLENKMNTYALNNTSGSFVFLDGAYLWDNYLFNTNVKWNNGSHIFLVSRFSDDSNYVTCTFSDDSIRIDQFESKDNIRLAEIKNKYAFNKEDISFGIMVEDKKTSCIVDGNVVLTTPNMSSRLSNGGIGIKTWDEQNGISNLEINSVSVVSIKGNSSDVLATLNKKPLVEKEIKNDNKNKPKPIPKPLVDIYKKIEFPYYKTDIEIGTIAKDWKNLWGKLSINYDGFIMSSGDKTSGSFAIMPGSKEWKNYSYKVKIDLIKGLSFGLIAREIDPENYVSCTFINYGYASYVKLDRVVNGKTEMLSKIKLGKLFPYKWENLAFGIDVVDNEVTCLANGDIILSSKIPGLQNMGGAGLKTWDEKNGNSEIKIRTIDIQNN